MLTMASVSWALAGRAGAEFNAWNDENIRQAQADPALQPLRGKLWFGKNMNTPISYFSNTSKPTAREKRAIKKLYEKMLSAHQWLMEWQRRFNLPYEDIFISYTSAKQSLLIDLYSGHLTYGRYTRMSRELANQLDKAQAARNRQSQQQFVNFLLTQQLINTMNQPASVAPFVCHNVGGGNYHCQ